MLASIRRKTFARVALLSKYSFVNSFHSRRVSLERFAYLHASQVSVLAKKAYGSPLIQLLPPVYVLKQKERNGWDQQHSPISREVNQKPGVVDDEMVDALCFTCRHMWVFKDIILSFVQILFAGAGS